MAGSLRARVPVGGQTHGRDCPHRRSNEIAAPEPSAISCWRPCGSSRSRTSAWSCCGSIAFDGVRLAALNAQTLWLYLPVYAIASAAWCFRESRWRSWRPRWSCPDRGRRAEHRPAAGDRRRPRASAAAARAQRERALLEPDAGAARARADAADADVVLLQEVTPRWLDVLDAAGFDRRYRTGVTVPLDDSRGWRCTHAGRSPARSSSSRSRTDDLDASACVGPTSRSSTCTTIGPPEASRPDAAIDVIAEPVAPRACSRRSAATSTATPYSTTVHRMYDLGLDERDDRLRRRRLEADADRTASTRAADAARPRAVDDALAVLDIRELRRSGSDHKPVLVDLAVMPPGERRPGPYTGAP